MRDAEVFRLARRAKGLKAEVEELGSESKEEDVEAMLDRADSLKKDVVSVKAIQGFKVSVVILSEALCLVYYCLRQLTLRRRTSAASPQQSTPSARSCRITRW